MKRPNIYTHQRSLEHEQISSKGRAIFTRIYIFLFFFPPTTTTFCPQRRVKRPQPSLSSSASARPAQSQLFPLERETPVDLSAVPFTFSLLFQSSARHSIAPTKQPRIEVEADRYNLCRCNSQPYKKKNKSSLPCAGSPETLRSQLSSIRRNRRHNSNKHSSPYVRTWKSVVSGWRRATFGPFFVTSGM